MANPSSKKTGPPEKPNSQNDNSRKKRRLRTKQCVKCMTPCAILNRCKISRKRGWVFICDICWPTHCPEDTNYEFGGTWYNGRMVDHPNKERARKPKQNKKPARKQEAPAASTQTKPADNKTDNQNRKPRKRRRRSKNSNEATAQAIDTAQKGTEQKAAPKPQRKRRKRNSPPPPKDSD